MMSVINLPIFLVILTAAPITPFVLQRPLLVATKHFSFSHQNQQQHQPLYSQPPNGEPQSIYLDPTLTPTRTRSLFAWISRAFSSNSNDDQYNNLMLAMAAIFGTNLPPTSPLHTMVESALSSLPPNPSTPTGSPLPLYLREQSSLGAMGAGQWTGHYRTRPHALLSVRNMTDVHDWIGSLPRGCRRTLKKANDATVTVTSRPIEGDAPAPHSSLDHFKCVVEHEVRLITREYAEYDDGDDVQGFFSALSEAVSRYVGTTRMAGVIREYRNEKGEVIAFAHEVRKGRTMRGQWFYATDEGSKNYVWFHSVQELVRRAIECEGVDTVDLGPSGSDAFSELKGRYGFESVEDWPSVADYRGSFYYEDEEGNVKESEGDEGGEKRRRMMDLLRFLGN